MSSLFYILSFVCLTILESTYGLVNCTHSLSSEPDPKQLIFIQQNANKRNVDVAYRDYAVNTTAFAQNAKYIPFRKQWFYLQPCTDTMIHFQTFERGYFLQVSKIPNINGTYNITVRPPIIGKRRQLFSITSDGAIYNKRFATGKVLVLTIGGKPNDELAPVFMQQQDNPPQKLPNEQHWRIVFKSQGNTVPTGPSIAEAMKAINAAGVVTTTASSTPVVSSSMAATVETTIEASTAQSTALTSIDTTTAALTEAPTTVLETSTEALTTQSPAVTYILTSSVVLDTSTTILDTTIAASTAQSTDLTSIDTTQTASLTDVPTTVAATSTEALATQSSTMSDVLTSVIPDTSITILDTTVEASTAQSTALASIATSTDELIMDAPTTAFDTTSTNAPAVQGLPGNNGIATSATYFDSSAVINPTIEASTAQSPSIKTDTTTTVMVVTDTPTMSVFDTSTEASTSQSPTVKSDIATTMSVIPDTSATALDTTTMEALTTESPAITSTDMATTVILTDTPTTMNTEASTAKPPEVATLCTLYSYISKSYGAPMCKTG